MEDPRSASAMSAVLGAPSSRTSSPASDARGNSTTPARKASSGFQARDSEEYPSAPSREAKRTKQDDGQCTIAATSPLQPPSAVTNRSSVRPALASTPKRLIPQHAVRTRRPRTDPQIDATESVKTEAGEIVCEKEDALTFKEALKALEPPLSSPPPPASPHQVDAQKPALVSPSGSQARASLLKVKTRASATQNAEPAEDDRTCSWEELSELARLAAEDGKRSPKGQKKRKSAPVPLLPPSALDDDVTQSEESQSSLPAKSTPKKKEKREQKDKDKDSEKRWSRRAWTLEEEEKFLEGLKTYGRNWKRIKHQCLPQRSPKQIYTHYRYFARAFTDNVLAQSGAAEGLAVRRVGQLGRPSLDSSGRKRKQDSSDADKLAVLQELEAFVLNMERVDPSR